MVQGDGGAFGVRIHRAGWGKVVFCCFEAIKVEEQAENLHWFFSLSRCTAIPQSSRGARVPICGGNCAVEEGRDLLCREFQILMGQRKKAKKNKTHPQKCKSEVTCLWALSKAVAGWGSTACAVPIKASPVRVPDLVLVWVSVPKQLYKCALLPCSCLPYFLFFIHQVVGAVSGSSIKPKSDDFQRYCYLVKEIHP